jgi:hypothetical protein
MPFDIGHHLVLPTPLHRLRAMKLHIIDDNPDHQFKVYKLIKALDKPDQVTSLKMDARFTDTCSS